MKKHTYIHTGSYTWALSWSCCVQRLRVRGSITICNAPVWLIWIQLLCLCLKTDLLVRPDQNPSNRSADQWYFPLPSKRAFSGTIILKNVAFLRHLVNQELMKLPSIASVLNVQSKKQKLDRLDIFATSISSRLNKSAEFLKSVDGVLGIWNQVVGWTVQPNPLWLNDRKLEMFWQ